jgi:uncharacterized protein DUF2336
MSSSLIKLAREGTDEAHKQLFAQISDLVAADLDQRSDNELALFAEVMLQLYGLSSAKDRSRLAQKLAPQSNTPPQLARRIAEDEVNVAMPVLASCPVLSQEDLLDIVERISNAHLQVLARRPDLSTEVSDEIAKKGDRPVHRILAGNREIKLSRETMLDLVKYAAEDGVLLEDLALRSDLTPTVCQALLPLVNDDTRRRLRGIIEGSLNQEQLDQMARLKVLRREFGKALEHTDMSMLWREAERARVTVDELMILLLQDGRFNHAIEILSSRGRTALKSLKDAVFNGKKELVLRTASKAGLKSPTFALFVKTRGEHMKIPSAQGSDWTSSYVKFLEANAAAKQSRCGDFQAKRKVKKSDRETRVSVSKANRF